MIDAIPVGDRLDTPPPVEDPMGRWRWEALKRADYRCERCGAEHNHPVVRYLYNDPADFVPFVPGVRVPPPCLVVVVHVHLVAAQPTYVCSVAVVG